MIKEKITRIKDNFKLLHHIGLAAAEEHKQKREEKNAGRRL